MPCTSRRSARNMSRPSRCTDSDLREFSKSWKIGVETPIAPSIRYASPPQSRAARLPEEGENRRLNAEAGHGLDQTTTDGCRTVGEGVANMSKRKTRAADGEVGTA